MDGRILRLQATYKNSLIYHWIEWSNIKEGPIYPYLESHFSKEELKFFVDIDYFIEELMKFDLIEEV